MAKLYFCVPLQDFNYPLWRETDDVDGFLVSYFGLWRRDATLEGIGLPKGTDVLIDSGAYSAANSGVSLPSQEEYAADTVKRCAGYEVSIIQQDIVGDGEATAERAAEFIELADRYGFTPVTVVQGKTIPDYIRIFESMLAGGLLTDTFAVGGLLWLQKYVPHSHIAHLIRYIKGNSEGRKVHLLGYYRHLADSVDSNLPLILAEQGIRYDGPQKKTKVSEEFSPEILLHNYRAFRDYLRSKEHYKLSAPTPAAPSEAVPKPFQSEVLEHLTLGENVLVSATTGLGKTFLSTELLPRQGRTILLEPYRAIVSEFAQALENSDLKVGFKYEGKEDMEEGWNILLSTYKSFEIILQKPSKYALETVQYLVVDEAHLAEKAPLETIINLFKAINPRAAVMVMSGTLVPEQWAWLDPYVIEASKDRGIVREKVAVNGETDKIHALVNVVNRLEKPVLVFRSTKKSVEKSAMEIAYNSKPELEVKLKGDHKKDSMLIEPLRRRVGIHHGALDPDTRRYVEQLYRDNALSCIVATSTLSAGVNLPARSVVIADTHGYTGSGFTLDINNWLQSEGRLRSGGTSVIMVNRDQEKEADPYMDCYTPRPIDGKGGDQRLAFQDSLHVATYICYRPDFEEFVKLGIMPSAGQYQMLQDAGILKEDGDRFAVVKIGQVGIKMGLEIHQFKVVSFLNELYKLRRQDLPSRFTLNDYLMALTYALNTRPYVEKTLFRYKLKLSYGNEWYQEKFSLNCNGSCYRFLKVAKVLDLWIKGTPKVKILKQTGLYPYELRNLIEDAIQTTSNMVVLFKILKQPMNHMNLEVLLDGLENGIPKEWREYLAIEGIGRERVIKLSEKAAELEKDLSDLDYDDILSIDGIGEKLASKITEKIKVS